MGRIGDILSRCGLSEQEFASVRYEMREKNRRMLALISSIAAVSFLCIFLSSMVSGGSVVQGGRQWAYLALGLFSAGVAAVSLWLLPRIRRLTLSLCYLFLCVMFIFAIWAGTFSQPEYPATTFCVFLVALPLMITDKPYRMSLFLALVSVLFLLSGGTCKAWEVLELDMLNCTCFIFLSITVGTTMNRTRVRELAQRKVIERQRDMDQLSGLLNKAAFTREMEMEAGAGQPGALLVLDIDNFKHFNDTYGHIFGDAVIRMVAEKITKMFPEPALTGRFGGDEFVIYQVGELSRHEVERRAALLRHALIKEAGLPEQTDKVTISIGIVFSPGGVPYEQLFASADRALYQAKNEGKNRACIAADVHREEKKDEAGGSSALRRLLLWLTAEKKTS